VDEQRSCGTSGLLLVPRTWGHQPPAGLRLSLPTTEWYPVDAEDRLSRPGDAASNGGRAIQTADVRPESAYPPASMGGKRRQNGARSSPPAIQAAVVPVIDACTGSHFFLSNFSESPVDFEGAVYPTVEQRVRRGQDTGSR
jgi:hypothetical protein